MRALIESYFTYYTHPEKVVYALVRQRRFGIAVTGYLAAAVCWVCFFWLGAHLTAWGFVWRLLFFWLLEITVGYLWAALSGLFLSFFSHENGSATLFISLGISGFVQSFLLCFALWRGVFPILSSLAGLIVFITLVLRFSFAVLNTARGGQVGLNKALGALCFAFVPVFALMFLGLGAIIILIA